MYVGSASCHFSPLHETRIFAGLSAREWGRVVGALAIAQPSWARRTLAAVAAMVFAASASGCGGGDGSSGSAAGPSVIRGGGRLAWNQMADPSALQALSFKLYVDGAASTLTNVSCGDTLTPAGYECSGTLPSFSSGRHVLQLTSVINGVESPRSAPLTITVD